MPPTNAEKGIVVVMIKIIEKSTASVLWDIEGARVSLIYRKEYPELVLAEEIKVFRDILQCRGYELDNSGLCRTFRIFGGISFVVVGMTVLRYCTIIIMILHEN